MMKKIDVMPVMLRAVEEFRNEKHSKDEIARRKALFLESHKKNTFESIIAKSLMKDEEALKIEAEQRKAKFVVLAVLVPLFSVSILFLYNLLADAFESHEKLKKSLDNDYSVLSSKIVELNKDRVDTRLELLKYQCGEVSDEYDCVRTRKRIKNIERQMKDAEFEKGLVEKRTKNL